MTHPRFIAGGTAATRARTADGPQQHQQGGALAVDGVDALCERVGVEGVQHADGIGPGGRGCVHAVIMHGRAG